MLRNNWSFQFAASKLTVACEAKKTHHESRLKFWEGAKEKVMAEVKDTGIEISESEAGGSYSNRSSGMGPQVMVRTDLQRKLTECHSKIIEHSGKVQEYEGWRQVLSGNPNESLSLNADDYLFFFGK